MKWITLLYRELFSFFIHLVGSTFRDVACNMYRTGILWNNSLRTFDTDLFVAIYVNNKRQ